MFKNKWLAIFWLSAAVSLAGNVFYIIFASGEQQKWDVLIKNTAENITLAKDEKEDQCLQHQP